MRKAKATLRAAAPSLFQCIGIKPHKTVVIPVLGSQETSAVPKSKNARLAKAIAKGAGTKFVLSCLKKKKHEPLHIQPDKYARDAALRRAKYRASKLKCKNVLIVDDIVTRGATMAKVAKAVLRSNPKVKIYGFALGRHIREEWLFKEDIFDIDEANANIPRKFNKVWKRS